MLLRTRSRTQSRSPPTLRHRRKTYVAVNLDISKHTFESSAKDESESEPKERVKLNQINIPLRESYQLCSALLFSFAILRRAIHIIILRPVHTSARCVWAIYGMISTRITHNYPVDFHRLQASLSPSLRCLCPFTFDQYMDECRPLKVHHTEHLACKNSQQ